MRNFQLYKLGVGDLNNKEKKIYNYLKENLSELSCFEDEDNPGVSLFGKDRTGILFKYDSKKEYLYISYNDVCEFLIEEMGIGIIGSKELVDSWIDLTFDLRIKRIYSIYAFSSYLWKK